jgi:hypothetical protein
VTVVAVGKMGGGDTDEHRCVRSAGYSWCESTSKCIESWVGGEARGLAVAAEVLGVRCSEGIRASKLFVHIKMGLPAQKHSPRPYPTAAWPGKGKIGHRSL